MGFFSEKVAPKVKFLLLVMLVGAIGMQAYAFVTCDFLGFSNGDQTGSIGLIYWNPIRNATNGTVVDEGECVQYPYDWSSNVFLTTSRTSMAVALGAAGLAALLEMVDYMCCQLCLAKTLKGVAMLITTLASGIVFTIFTNEYCRSGNSCTWGIGAILNASALGLYFLFGMLSSCVPKTEPICFRKKKEEEEPPIYVDPSDKEAAMEEGPINEYEPYDPSRHTDVGVTSSNAEVNYATTGY